MRDSEISDKDKAAFFEQLYNDYGKLMLLKAMEYGVDNAWVGDVVHDSFVRLFGRYETLRKLDKNALTAYVVATVRSVAINSIRDNPAAIPIDEDAFEKDETESPEESVLNHQKIESLMAAVDKLSQDERLLIEERYALELSTAELAELYGLSEGNIRVKLTRIRKKLHKLLKEAEDEYAER